MVKRAFFLFVPQEQQLDQYFEKSVKRISSMTVELNCGRSLSMKTGFDSIPQRHEKRCTAAANHSVLYCLKRPMVKLVSS